MVEFQSGLWNDALTRVVNVITATPVYTVYTYLSLPYMQLGIPSATQIGYHFEEAGCVRD